MKRKWVVWVAIFQHLIWAICLFISPSAAGVTAISAISNWAGGASYAKYVILIVALLALVSLCLSTDSKKPKWYWTVMLIPQQLVLMVSAIGAVECISRGMFADGVPRPVPFMFADQIPSILIAIFHTCAIFDPLTTRGHQCPKLDKECPF